MESKIKMVNDIKNELKSLYDTVEPIVDYFNDNSSFPQQITASVLLQNVCFDVGDVNDENYEKHLNKIKNIGEMLKKLSNYLKCDHVVNFISNEFNNIVFAHEMIESNDSDECE